MNQSAVVYRREQPQQTFTGKVTRTADALDPNTRTLLTQVDVSNPDNVLRPGMYLQVKFVFDRHAVPLRCLDYLEGIQRPRPEPNPARGGDGGDKPDQLSAEEMRDWCRRFGVEDEEDGLP